MTDADFLREFRKGNKEAFSGLVERYSKPITMMILRMVKDLEEAKDISQTVFLKAYEGLPTFMMNSSFKTWLYRIAMNAANDYIRKRKPNIYAGFMEDFPGPAISPGEQLDRVTLFGKIKASNRRTAGKTAAYVTTENLRRIELQGNCQNFGRNCGRRKRQFFSGNQNT